MAADAVILSVRLASGDFESSLSIPIDAPKLAKDKAVIDWLDIIQVAFRTNATELSVVLSSPEGEANG